MPFGTRLKKVAFAEATGVPQRLTVEGTGERVLYVPKVRDTAGEGFYMPIPETYAAPTPTPERVDAPRPTNGLIPQVITHVAPQPILLGPDVFTGPPPPEAQAIDRLPDTPPPGPAVPPQEPLWAAFLKGFMEKREPAPAPSFAVPSPQQAFADATAGGVAPVRAGFDMQKMMIPAALAIGAYFLLSR